MLEQLFKLSENKTNVKTEVVAGITTFLTMAYIIFVNPDILQAAKMPLAPSTSTGPARSRTARAAAIRWSGPDPGMALGWDLFMATI